MSFNPLILEKLEAENYLALLLDKAVNDVKNEAIKQTKLIQKGAERLSWYSACFFDNYQDVCKNLKNEDIRFGKALIQLVKRNDVIRYMIELYVNDLLGTLSEERIINIQRILIRLGGKISSISLTVYTFTYALSSAIYTSTRLRHSINSKLTTRLKGSIELLGYYGRVQTAADSAKNLKLRHPLYYASLYHAEVEMLFFLIEDVIIKNDRYNLMTKKDGEIAEELVRLTR